MTRVDEFNSFYSATFAEVVAVTYAICSDRDVAHESTVDAYRRAWRDWAKIRDRNAIAYVRTEAWKLTSLNKSTHPLRKKAGDGSDADLIEALADLDVDDRRLIALLTLGHTDLDHASREVGIDAEEAIERVTQALESLEKALGVGIDAVERRMHGLASVAQAMERPDSSTVRTAARRGRQRNTVLLVAVAVAVILGGGWLSTNQGAWESEGELPHRQKIGAETQDVVLKAERIDATDLLTTTQLSPLNDKRTWKTASTDDDVSNTTPYATCPTTRYGDKDPLKVLVRTFTTEGKTAGRIAQSIEVSRTEKAAKATNEQLISWYANCEHPRVELLGAWTARRTAGDFTIMTLRSHRSPVRTFTVGFSRTGTVNNTLLYEVDGGRVPSVNAFAQVLSDAVAKFCGDTDAACSDQFSVARTAPPATTKAPAFLGVVDLPPIDKFVNVWAAAPFAAKTNPAATLCDNATYTSKSVKKAGSRIYVLYQAKGLPKEFGISQTVARFTSSAKARRFVELVNERVAACEDEILSARVDQNKKIKESQFAGNVRRVSFKVAAKGKASDRVYYRTAIIRRGSAVTQVTFTPAGKFDISQERFEQIAMRAGARLKYLP